ncbi:MAG: DUF3332 domain-containing protein [Leeuwenhoekiella sp.]
MKKLLTCSVMSLLMLCTSCLGSFSAFNNLKDWNMEISDSKFVNNLVFWALNIVPVYGLFFVGDVLIFNVIEFWSGSNPIAMNEGEVETQILAYKGNTYKMTATKNHFDIAIIEGERKGNHLLLSYEPEDRSWNAVKEDGEIIKLSSFKDGLMIVYMPNGEEVKIDANATRSQGLAQLEMAKHDYNFETRMTAVGN